MLANDTVTRWNMVVTPEEARYHVIKECAPGIADCERTWPPDDDAHGLPPIKG